MRDYSWSHFTSGRSTRELIETGETGGAASSHLSIGGIDMLGKKKKKNGKESERIKLRDPGFATH